MKSQYQVKFIILSSFNKETEQFLDEVSIFKIYDIVIEGNI